MERPSVSPSRTPPVVVRIQRASRPRATGAKEPHAVPNRVTNRNLPVSPAQSPCTVIEEPATRADAPLPTSETLVLDRICNDAAMGSIGTHCPLAGTDKNSVP